jgi:hypothetical protein
MPLTYESHDYILYDKIYTCVEKRLEDCLPRYKQWLSLRSIIMYTSILHYLYFAMVSIVINHEFLLQRIKNILKLKGDFGSHPIEN